MRRMLIEALIDRHSVGDVYQRWSRYTDWPSYSSSIHKVEMTNLDQGPARSEWEVAFGEGLLRWTQEDVFHPDQHSGSFRQIAGDVEELAGSWALKGGGDACSFTFTVEFELGIPSLADLLEPVGEQALRENIESVLRGLFGQCVTFISPTPAESF